MRKIFLYIFLISNFGLNAQQRPAYVEAEMKRATMRLQAREITYAYPYDWIYQRLELTVDPRQQYVNGNTTVYFKPGSDLPVLELDLSDDLTVHQVSWHGQNLSFAHAGDRISVSFPSALPAGQTDSVRIVYEGIPPGGGFGAFSTDEHDQVPVLWTLSEPYGAKEWWPCKDQLQDKLDSVDVILHYPAQINGEEMTGVSNGILVAENISGNEKTSHWRHRHKIPAYLVAIAVTNYAKFSNQAGLYRSFPIDHFVYPEDSTEAAVRLPVIVDLMNFYEEKYGEYRFSDEKYGHAEFGWGGGMEHTTITFIGGFSRGLISHELAHQWFGDDVTCATWPDIWLNEGFATYSEALTQKHFDGEAAFKSWRNYANSLITQRPHQSVYVYDDDTMDIGRLFSWRTTYLKGAMVLHMIHWQTGDSLFFETLRSYRNKFHESTATTDDFLQVLDSVTGADFTEFFNDWIYGKGFPSYQVARRLISGTAWEIAIDQTPSDPLVAFFEMPLPIRFYGSHGEIFDTIVRHTSNGQHFYIDPGFTVDSVALDPEMHIVKGETTYLYMNQMEWETGFMLFPNPVSGGFWCFVKRPDKNPVLELFDLSGKMILRSRTNRYVPVKGLAKGVYIFRIPGDGGKNYGGKIIVH